MSTVTARVADETAAKLEALAKATKRSKSFHIAEALDTYLETQAWQVERIKDSIRQADAGQFASEKQIRTVFAEMGVDIENLNEDHLDG